MKGLNIHRGGRESASINGVAYLLWPNQKSEVADVKASITLGEEGVQDLKRERRSEKGAKACRSARESSGKLPLSLGETEKISKRRRVRSDQKMKKTEKQPKT